MSNKEKIDVSYIAELARLQISEEQAQKLQFDLEDIVSYIAELAELDVSDIEPTAYAGSLSNVWREDEAIKSPEEMRAGLLANAPDLVNAEAIKVPQVLPGEGMN